VTSLARCQPVLLVVLLQVEVLLQHRQRLRERLPAQRTCAVGRGGRGCSSSQPASRITGAPAAAGRCAASSCLLHVQLLLL
jgi:hypothetical protein